ncbi:MAG: hypothetical protein WAU69_05340 [Solirubrobacteraceae bacterium]
MKRLVAVLFAAGCLGGATQAYAAETPPPAVSVEGVANVALSQTASQTEADAAYRQGLAAAIGDGREKAEVLAVDTGAKVGPIQQIIERGGSIECGSPTAEGPLTEYQEYKGAEPDFGAVESSGSRFAVAPETASSTAPHKTTKPKRKKHRAKAKKASAVRCTLSAEVGLSYLLM